jgi:hypothetical protein
MPNDPKSQPGDQKGVGAENEGRDPATDRDKDKYPPNVTREKTRDTGIGDTVTDEGRDPRRPRP